MKSNPDELWVVTCKVEYSDQDSRKNKRGNIEWIDVDVQSTFEVYRGPRIECERYATIFKKPKVYEGKLVQKSSLIIGPARHWDDWDYRYDRILQPSKAQFAVLHLESILARTAKLLAAEEDKGLQTALVVASLKVLIQKAQEFIAILETE
jgi:hypothetical protein